MSNVIEQANRATLGLSATAPSSVNSYTVNRVFEGFSVPFFVIDGTAGNDSIVATSSPNVNIFGFGGNDTLSALTATGGISPAILYGGAGADTFILGVVPGADVIGGTIRDFSTSSGDILDLRGTGLTFAQLVITQVQEGFSTLQASGTKYAIAGLPGDVTLNATNVLTSGSGGTSSSNAGTAGNDVIVGTAAAETITGQGGNDNISGGDGNDLLSGNAGSDTVAGAAGNDTVQGGQGNDVLSGDQGNDNVLGGQGDDQLRGGQGNDTLQAGQGNDTVLAGLGDDQLRGGQGNDSLVGGAGNDSIYGDLGNDNFTGGDGIDYFHFLTTDHGDDVVTDFTSGTDFLAFSSTVFATASAAVAAFSGGILDAGVSSITLTGVTSISASDIMII